MAPRLATSITVCRFLVHRIPCCPTARPRGTALRAPTGMQRRDPTSPAICGHDSWCENLPLMSKNEDEIDEIDRIPQSRGDGFQHPAPNVGSPNVGLLHASRQSTCACRMGLSSSSRKGEGARSHATSGGSYTPKSHSRPRPALPGTICLMSQCDCHTPEPTTC